MIKELLAKVSAKQDLTFDEAKQAIDEIMSGEVSEAVISSFLTALAMKGETEEEIAGAATPPTLPTSPTRSCSCA